MTKKKTIQATISIPAGVAGPNDPIPLCDYPLKVNAEPGRDLTIGELVDAYTKSGYRIEINAIPMKPRKEKGKLRYDAMPVALWETDTFVLAKQYRIRDGKKPSYLEIYGNPKKQAVMVKVTGPIQAVCLVTPVDSNTLIFR